MIPYGRKYTCSKSGSILKRVVCERCGKKYSYKVEATARGTGTSILWLENSSAAARAVSAAERSLQKKLQGTVRVVPCPSCSWHQKDMVRQTRRRAIPFVAFGALALLVGCVSSHSPLRIAYISGGTFLVFIGLVKWSRASNKMSRIEPELSRDNEPKYNPQQKQKVETYYVYPNGEVTDTLLQPPPMPTGKKPNSAEYSQSRRQEAAPLFADSQDHIFKDDDKKIRRRRDFGDISRSVAASVVVGAMFYGANGWHKTGVANRQVELQNRGRQQSANSASIDRTAIAWPIAKENSKPSLEPPRPQEAHRPIQTEFIESDPTKELVAFADGLRQGRYVFNRELSGEEAALQLGYSRLFASAFDEVSLYVRRKLLNTGVAHINDVLAEFDRITAEERKIQGLLVARSRTSTSIGYLRALQNGDVVFPGPKTDAPTPRRLLAQMRLAYPREKIDLDDSVFVALYANIREFAVAQVVAGNEVWIHDIISKIRSEIIDLATASERAKGSCNQWTTVGALKAIVAVCPQLELNSDIKSFDALQGEADIGRCQSKAFATLEKTLSGWQSSRVKSVCQQLEEQVRHGEMTTLAMRKQER